MSTIRRRALVRQAGDDEILALAEIGWRGDYQADEVAFFCESTDAGVAAFFEGLERVECAGNRPVGFECQVDEAPAMNWLRKFRAELVKKIEEENDDEEDHDC